MEILLHTSTKKRKEKKKKRKKKEEEEEKKAYGFQISHFYGSFSNDIMAVKGLKT